MTEEADEIRDRRRAFAAPGGPHDELVRLVARYMPAAVGVIAALLILTPLSPRGEVSFLLDRNKVATAQDRLRIDNAMYRGQDDQGRPFSVTAGQAVQRSASEPVVRMADLAARILLDDGPAVLTADSGQYDFEDNQVEIDGLVKFEASDGYRMVASNVSVNLTTKTLQGKGRVEGALPAGTFAADSIVADLGERSVALVGDAKLHMIPGKLGMD